MWAILITVILAIIIIIIVSVVLNNKKMKNLDFFVTTFKYISTLFIFLKNIEEN